MKTEKRLEEKIIEAEEFLPGVGEKLKSSGWATWGIHYNKHSEDVERVETEKYKVVAVKRQAREWSDGGGGIKITEWVAVYYLGEEGELKGTIPEKIITRDQNDAYKDRNDLLYKYDYVGLEALADDKVEVAWLDKDGKKGPTYEIKLE
jgi:hypothetical protein